MINKREVNDIPYAGYTIDSYILIDDKGEFIIPACDFLLDIAISGSPINTIKSYASDLVSFFSQLSSVRGIDSVFPSHYSEVNAEHLDAYLIGFLFQNKKMSYSSVIRHSATLNLFYDFAFKNGYLNVFLQWKNKSKLNNRATLMDKTLSRIGSHYIEREVFDTFILPNIKANSSFKRERDELALKLGYFAGIRTHELIANGNFTISRMEKLIPKGTSILLDDHITIFGKGSKARKLPLWPELVSSLHNFLYGVHRGKLKDTLFENGRGKPLCDEQYGSDVFRAAMNNYLKNNSVESQVYDSLKQKSFHSLRHSFATNAVTFCYETEAKYSPKWAVMQWMGHSDEKTTDIYICFEAIKNNRLGVIDSMKLSELAFPKSVKEG